MPIWQLHMLNARGALTPIMAEIRAHAREVVALVEAHLDLPRFDLVVRAGDHGVPDWGIAGQAPSPGVIELVLDPARVTPEHFRRTLVRQMHRLARWEGPGHGPSLGEALVGEGLAGHFVLQVMGGPADPWDQVRPVSGTLKQAAAGWARRDHDAGEWFLGRGRMRKWTGFGLGHRLVAEHLAEGQDAAALVHAPADAFRQALRRLMAVEGIEEEVPIADDAEREAVAEPAEATAPEAEAEPVASRDAGGPAPRTPRPE